MNIIEELKNSNSSEEKLSLLEKYQFPISLKKKEDKFILSCSSLGIITGDTDLNKAYTSLIEKKKNLFSELIAIGEELDLPFNSVNQASNTSGAVNVKANTGKYIIIRDIVILFLFLAVALGGASAIKKSGKKLKHKISKSFNPTPEKKAKYERNFRKNMELIKPYVNIAKDVFSEN